MASGFSGVAAAIDELPLGALGAAEFGCVRVRCRDVV